MHDHARAPDPVELGPTRLDRDAWWFRAFLVGIAAVGPFSLNVFSPCLPWIRDDFGVELGTVQLSASLSILAAALATVVAGPLTDVLGRRPVLVASLGLYVLGSAAGALAPHIALLVSGRVLQAACSSVAFVTARALIHDVYGEAASARVIARVSLVTVFAVVLAPLAGGALIATLGWRAVFWTTTALGIVLVIVAHGRVPETARASARPSLRGGLDGVAILLRAPRYHGFAMQSSLQFATFFAFTATASHLMVDVLRQPATGYGLWFVLLSVCVGAGLALAERLSTRIGPGTLAAIGSLIALGGSICSAFFLLFEPLSAASLFAPVSLCALGIGLAVPGTNAGVMSVRPRLAGTASGLMGFQQYVLAAVFAQLVVQDEAHAAQALAIAGLVACGGAVAFSVLSLSPGRAVAHGAIARGAVR